MFERFEPLLNARSEELATPGQLALIEDAAE
jgi:hypothetical protein